MPAVVLVTGGYDHTLRFWEASSGQCYRALQFHGSQINRLAVTEDKRLVVATGNPFVRVFEVEGPSTTPMIQYEGHKGNVTAVGFQRDVKWFFTASEDSTAKLWDTRTPKPQMSFDTLTPINCGVLHPNQGELVLGGADGKLRIWDLAADKCCAELPTLRERPQPVQSISVARDGQDIAAVTQNGHVFLWNPVESTSSTEFSAPLTARVHNGYTLRCTLSPDSSLLAVSCSDCTVKLASLHDLCTVQTLTGHSRWVWDTVFSADSCYLVSASSDNTARLWDLEEGESVKVYSGHAKAVTAVALNDFGE